jgi:polyisoprenoid-binding protein YceI
VGSPFGCASLCAQNGTNVVWPFFSQQVFFKRHKKHVERVLLPAFRAKIVRLWAIGEGLIFVSNSIFMLRTRNSFFAILVATLALTACQNEPKTATADPNVPPKPDTIRMAPTPSAEGAAAFGVTEGMVYWAAKKFKGQHNGTIKIEGGELLVKDGQLLSGTVTINLASIEAADLKDPSEKSDLESHLKSGDFFDAVKFPTATFKIEEVLPSNLPDFNSVISGSLTIKGKTETVNVPVMLKIDGTDLEAKSASFIINRTKWGINFRSGILGTAKDKLIEDNVVLSLTLKAKAK